nr:hypothetical protein BaRGS_020485 [Batillaria attramentaria]KAG5700262.1 hypothetical protein BaRGS_022889 [Batillaria attramentaria]
MEEKRVKVVHMYRNPKDTVVSAWFHYKQLPPRQGNPVDCVRRLAWYLEVDVTDKLCQDIAHACSFHNMQTVGDKKTLPRDTAITLDAKMYRKGEVGDWKNHLTVADSELIDLAVAQGTTVHRFPKVQMPGKY